MKALIYIEDCGFVSIPENRHRSENLVIVAKGGKDYLVVKILEFGEKSIGEDNRSAFLLPKL